MSTTPSLAPSRAATPAARCPRRTPPPSHAAPATSRLSTAAPRPCVAISPPHVRATPLSRPRRPHVPPPPSATFVRPHAPPCALAHAPSAVVTRPSAAQRPRPPPPCSGQALPSLRAALTRPSDTASCLLDPCRGPSDCYAPHRHRRCLVHPYHPHTPSRFRAAPPRASVPPQHNLTAPSRAPASLPRNWWHCLIARGPTSPSDALALPLCMPALWPCVPVPPFRTSAPPSQFLNADGHECACAEKTHKWSIREVEHSTEVFIGKSCFHLPMFSLHPSAAAPRLHEAASCPHATVVRLCACDTAPPASAAFAHLCRPCIPLLPWHIHALPIRSRPMPTCCHITPAHSHFVLVRRCYALVRSRLVPIRRLRAPLLPSCDPAALAYPCAAPLLPLHAVSATLRPSPLPPPHFAP
ncbi:hypothetical protein DENSPDRAFT_885478 [Dentipellis sp. KUC8613]|nr:hypothetical protein DENSPDRAFT_885478 [Dentipellis sp. KUC8613]